MLEGSMAQMPPQKGKEEMIADKITAITQEVGEIRNAGSIAQKERLLEALINKLEGAEFADVSDFFMGTDKIQSAFAEVIKDSLKTDTLSVSMLEKLLKLRGFDKNLFDRDPELQNSLEERFKSNLKSLSSQRHFSLVRKIIEKELLPKTKIESLVGKEYVTAVFQQLGGGSGDWETAKEELKSLRVFSKEKGIDGIDVVLGRAYNEFLESVKKQKTLDSRDRQFIKEFEKEFPHIAKALKIHQEELKSLEMNKEE